MKDYGLPPVIETAPWILADGGALDIDRCPDCWERRAHIERYVFACRVFRNARVLDFGCGVGFGSEMLVRAGNTVRGLDQSIQAVSLAMSRHNNEFPRTMLDFTMFSSDLRTTIDFDGCVALEVIEHLEDPADFIATVPAKHLVASVPVRPTKDSNHHHKHDFTVESFRALVETRFEIKSWWVQIEPFHNSPSIMIVHGSEKT
jgi:SAM-dependent methyltransferase